jgi:hypothetical protein
VLTRIGATESVSLCERMKNWLRLHLGSILDYIERSAARQKLKRRPTSPKAPFQTEMFFES